MAVYATCIDKGPGDHTVILKKRAYVVQPFEATNWLDLRWGFFLSVTDDTADDTITGLAETIVNPGVMAPQDRYWIGLKDNSTLFPREPSTVFIGYTNSSFASGALDKGDSRLSTSDGLIGTTNANFWRPNNSLSAERNFLVLDGHSVRAVPDGLNQHFVQNVAGAGGYAVLLGLRLQRDTPESNTITVQVKSTAHSADMLYSSAPTQDLIKTTIENAWPASTQVGPVALRKVPDALFLYWPFLLSRLRIHSMHFSKIR